MAENEAHTSSASQNGQDRPNIIWLPNETILNVVRHLKTPNFMRLITTCKRFYNSTLLWELHKRDREVDDCHSLWWACQTGTLATLKRALDCGCDVNRYFDRCHYHGHFIRGNLPRYDINRSVGSGIDTTPLVVAIRAHQVEAVIMLFLHGAAVEKDDRAPVSRVDDKDVFKCHLHRWKPIHWVLHKGRGWDVHLERKAVMLRILLDRGADPNAVPFERFRTNGHWGRIDRHMNEAFPLDLSTQQGIPAENTRLLLERGALTSERTHFDRITVPNPMEVPLITLIRRYAEYATCADPEFREKLQLLLRAYQGEEPTLSDLYGWMYNGEFWIMTMRNLDIAAFFIEQNIIRQGPTSSFGFSHIARLMTPCIFPINARNRFNGPMYRFKDVNDDDMSMGMDVLSLLVQIGPLQPCRFRDDWPPGHSTVTLLALLSRIDSEHALEVLEKLVTDDDVDLNQQRYSGMTALHFACDFTYGGQRYGRPHSRTVSMLRLLATPRNIQHLDYCDRTPFDVLIATTHGTLHDEIILPVLDFLVCREVSPTSLVKIANDGRELIARSLLEIGFPILGFWGRCRLLVFLLSTSVTSLWLHAQMALSVGVRLAILKMSSVSTLSILRNFQLLPESG